MKATKPLRLELLDRFHAEALTEMAEEFLAEGDARFPPLVDDADEFFQAAERFRLGKDLPSDRV